MTVTESVVRKSAGRNGEGLNLLEDLVAVIKSVCLEICWQKLGKGKYTGRFSDSHQICQSGNLLEEMGKG